MCMILLRAYLPIAISAITLMRIPCNPLSCWMTNCLDFLIPQYLPTKSNLTNWSISPQNNHIWALDHMQNLPMIPVPCLITLEYHNKMRNRKSLTDLPRISQIHKCLQSRLLFKGVSINPRKYSVSLADGGPSGPPLACLCTTNPS